MLPDIVAEVLHFLSRRDLDKASAASKLLDGIIAQCCEVYPLRTVHIVALYQIDYLDDFTTYVRFNGGLPTSFGSMDEAARFAGSILRHSFVAELEVIRHDSGAV